MQSAPIFLSEPSTVLDTVRSSISEQAISNYSMPRCLDSFDGFEDDYFISALLKPEPQFSHASVQFVVSSSTASLFSVYRVQDSPAYIASNVGMLAGSSCLASVIRAGLAAAEVAAQAVTAVQSEDSYWIEYQTAESVCSGKYGDSLARDLY